jgi:enoyl-CoA hydratase
METTTSDYQFLKVKKDEAAFIITLDNPPVNVLNLKLLEEIPRAIKQANDDPETRGIVITGAGTNAFCAGADLRMMQGFSPEEATKSVETGHQAFFIVENSPKPVIAAVNGLALGGGNELALSCDMRIVSDRARFGQPEAKLGLIPAWGGTQRMTRLIGAGKAKELIFSGQMINAQEALRIGLVNKIVPDGEELRAATDFVRMLAANVSPLAVAQAKMAINEGIQVASLKDAMGYELKAVKTLSTSNDLREGVQSFLEKRPPKFTGT